MLRKIYNTVAPFLKTDGGTILVAVSGGADSVCLLLAMKRLFPEIVAMHCNFHLRSTESDRDEQFVRSLCQQHAIKLEVKHFQTSEYARCHGISIEMAARELRYQWFRELREKYNAQAVVVGHHLDDQVETMLLNLVRGTGLHGLTGMRVCNEQGIIRPLIYLRRTEIEAWLTSQGQTWVTDSTNLDPDAAIRNKIRLHVLPLLQQLNPSVVNSLVSTMRHLTEAERIYQSRLAEDIKSVCTTNDHHTIDINALRQCASAETVLFELLHPHGFTPAQIHDIASGLDGEAGAIWASPSWRLLRDRGCLVLQEQASNMQPSEQDFPIALPSSGIMALPHSFHFSIDTVEVTNDFVIPRDKNTACFDFDKLTLPLEVRHIQQGDRMHPFGMKGTRLISDIITDHKLSRFKRERQLVLTSGNTIVWLVGIRIAAGFEIDQYSHRALVISYINNSSPKD